MGSRSYVGRWLATGTRLGASVERVHKAKQSIVIDSSCCVVLISSFWSRGWCIQFSVISSSGLIPFNKHISGYVPSNRLLSIVNLLSVWGDFLSSLMGICWAESCFFLHFEGWSRGKGWAMGEGVPLPQIKNLGVRRLLSLRDICDKAYRMQLRRRWIICGLVCMKRRKNLWWGISCTSAYPQWFWGSFSVGGKRFWSICDRLEGAIFYGFYYCCRQAFDSRSVYFCIFHFLSLGCHQVFLDLCLQLFSLTRQSYLGLILGDFSIDYWILCITW